MKNFLRSLLCFFVCTLIFNGCAKSYKPFQGEVSDEKTAIKIAEAYVAHEGNPDWKGCQFHSAGLSGDVWFVSGIKPLQDGGCWQITINKKDGKIIKVSSGY